VIVTENEGLGSSVRFCFEKCLKALLAGHGLPNPNESSLDWRISGFLQKGNFHFFGLPDTAVTPWTLSVRVGQNLKHEANFSLIKLVS
jgi:hypothetical protein